MGVAQICSFWRGKGSYMNLLEIQSMKKTFDGLEVIKDISLSVAEGEVVSIIGPSGSGKSTLLRCATMLEDMDGGQLSYLGQKAAWEEKGKNGQQQLVYASKKELRQIRKNFGLVFQSFHLFPHYTVLKNIIDAPVSVDKVPKQEAIERAESLLAQLGLSDKRDAYPYQLSGGQQQRVSIARAIILSPEVILADEPIGNLDSKSGEDVMNLFKTINKEEGITILQVTHSEESAKYGNRIIRLKDGKIV